MIECPEAGIYFQFDEEEYHAIPALGSTNLKDMLCHPVVFYANSWLNTFKPQASEQETIGKLYGSAYHTRILEGREKFYDNYAPSFDASLYPDAYDTSDEIKARLRELKEEGHTIKLSVNKPELIAQLLNCDPDAEILSDIREQYQESHSGIFLPQDVIDNIEYAAAHIEKHPQLSKCFTGGYPEVTIIWHHPDNPAIMLKARIDYLKLKAFIDLKTFANQKRKPIELALYGEMANYKYHIQATHYWDGVEAAVGFAKRGQVFGDYDQKWVQALAQTQDFEMFYVFQQTGNAPVARGKKFKRGSIYQCGVVAINQAIDLYNEYLNRFGNEQWVDMTPITDFYDDEFPVYTTEI